MPPPRSASGASTLSRAQARAVYDRVGARQDAQAFYEDPALDRLVRHGDFRSASSVFEIGCGTGRFAARLLREACPPDARYHGVDLSATMGRLARERLASFEGRARVDVTDGSLRFDAVAPASHDRVVATYVLDLLSDADVQTLLGAAHRMLVPDGRLGLAGLTWGTTPVSRLVARVWDAVHAVRPACVGGCRPMDVAARLDAARWRVLHRSVVVAWGIPSEVLVATPRS